MPSGSKKRKPAKKRKENQPNNKSNPSPASPQTHGDGDDVKPQDDKNSDTGEVSSPASQDRRSRQNNSSSSEEEIESENVSNPSLEGTETDVTDKPEKTSVELGFIPIEKESKIENESDENGKQLELEHDEKARKSHDGGPSGSSSSLSSSNDKSSEIKNSQSKNAPSVIVLVDASSSGEKDKIEASSEDNSSKEPSIEEPEIKESEVERPSIVDGKVGILEEEVIIPSVENVGAISDTREGLSQESDDRLSLSYNAPVASAAFEKDSGVSEPLLAPAPHAEGPERRTSWKSCCGLFEAFTASGR